MYAAEVDRRLSTPVYIQTLKGKSQNRRWIQVDKTGGPTTKGPSLRPSARRSEELSTRRIYVNDMNGEGNTTLSCLQGGLVIAP